MCPLSGLSGGLACSDKGEHFFKENEADTYAA